MLMDWQLDCQAILTRLDEGLPLHKASLLFPMQVGSDILQVRSEVARSVPLHNEVPEELDTTDYSVSEH